MTRVVVVGGGVSGLVAAWELVREGDPGLEVVLLEATDRVGGKLRLEEVAGARVDVGAEAMLTVRPEVGRLLAELELTDRATHPAAVGAQLWTREALRPLPAGTLMGVPGDASTALGILTDEEVRRADDSTGEVPLDTWAGRPDAPLGEVVAQRLGDAVVDRLVEPLLGGVYAGNARELSLRACLPQLWDAVAEGRSVTEVARAAAARSAATKQGGVPATPVFTTLTGGLGALPALMAAALTARGVTVRTGAVVRELRREGVTWALTVGSTRDPATIVADAVVLALPGRPASRLLADVAPRAAERLGEVEYASMVLVTFAFRRADLEGTPVGEALGSGSGFLVPPVDHRDIKASTFSSTKWPWLAQEHPDLVFVRASMGRAGDTASLQADDAELASRARADLETALGERLPDPADVHVQRWGGGLPQYEVGHVDRMAEVMGAVAEVDGLEVCGAVFEGVGIPACLASGRSAAERTRLALSARH